MRKVLVFVVFVFFVGCVDKHRVGYFGENKIQQQGLKYTKKQEVFLDDKRYLAVLTYLNPIQEKYNSSQKETFLLNMLKTPYEIKILEKNSNIQRLDYKASESKLSPTYSRWSNYYLITKPAKSEDEAMVSIAINGKHVFKFSFKK